MSAKLWIAEYCKFLKAEHQVAVNFKAQFNVRLSQFKKKKTIHDGIKFPGFFPKKPDLTELDRFSLNRFPVRFD